MKYPIFAGMEFAEAAAAAGAWSDCCAFISVYLALDSWEFLRDKYTRTGCCVTYTLEFLIAFAW